jgi:hypothetical protein
MNFFPKIPEINLGRFSFRFSFGVMKQSMKNKRNFKTFQLRIYQKTSNISSSVFNVRKLFTRINAEIDKLSGDMLLVAERLV